MGATYQAVGWNRQKRRYDAAAGAALLAYLALFIGLGLGMHPDSTIETLLIRGLGTAAFALLHIILIIGPAARFSDRFLPLLYNRRHLGVMMIVLALGHVALVTIQFHAFGPLNPLVSILTDGGLDGGGFSFQVLGLVAFIILLTMAATSHDFWLRNLTAPAWKRLHMGVYAAYLLLVAHVAWGILHEQHTLAWFVPLVVGSILVGGVHLASAVMESKQDRASPRIPAEDGFVEVCALADLPDRRGRTVVVGGDRVALFRYGNKVSAVSNACRHQNGPLGEGRIIDGCIVCPWHGYQYHPASGASPPPFTEKVPTFRVRVRQNRVFVHPTPLPPGTHTEPASVSE